MIEEDIEKDIKEATAEEEEAKADLASFKTDTEETVASLKTEITGYEEEIAECNDVIKDARTTRGDKKEVLDGALEYLRSIAKGCDFMAANFEYRQQNRYTEIDGLLERRPPSRAAPWLRRRRRWRRTPAEAGLARAGGGLLR